MTTTVNKNVVAQPNADIPRTSKNLEKPTLPGEVGVWLFVCGDLMVFSLIFGTFLYYRGLSVDVYQQSQQALNGAFGLANTFILLISSWLVVWAVSDARSGHFEPARRRIEIAIVLGLCFIGLKTLEWSEKVSSGITLVTNEFFMFYFMITGIHFGHMLVGLGALSYALHGLRGPVAQRSHMENLEGVAVFWHLVDLLWMIIFALFYVIR